MKLSDTIPVDTVWEYKTENHFYKLTVQEYENDELRFTLLTNDQDKVIMEGSDFKHKIINGLATDAVKRYYNTKRKYTTHFYAKTYNDKKFYQAMIDDLMKSANYKLIRSQNVDGGKLWVLQHKQAYL